MSDIKKLDKFKFPTAMDNIEKQATMLAQDLDLAIRNELTAQQVKDQVISRFPSLTISVLKQFGVKRITSYLAEQAPKDWSIAGEAGVKLIEDLFPLL